MIANEAIDYQVVVFFILLFLLVDDMSSRAAENEGLSLFLLLKWLPQGIFCLVDALFYPIALRISWDFLLFTPAFEVWEE